MAEPISPDPTIQRHLDDPITRHMRTDFSRVHIDQTVGEALNAIRAKPPEGRVIYIYVVDDEQHLKGVIPTRRLLLSALDAKVADIMVREVITLSHQATVLEACEFFTMHRLLAFPVVDEERRVLGIVDVELYTTELTGIDRSEQADYLFQLVGIHLAESQQSKPLIAFRSRFPWLLCNVAGGIVAAFLSGIFEEQLKTTVALALFIPVVLALAESVSIQSVSLALRALHGRPPTWRALADRAGWELIVGLLLGVACSMLVALVAVIWLGDTRVALSIFGGIAAGVTAAAVLGLTIPNLLHQFRLDPQVAAGPIALALADFLTLLVYFNLAKWLMT